MHDREIVLIAAAALVVGGLVWLALACARAAGRADQAAADAPCLVCEGKVIEAGDIAMWEDELQPQRPVYDWEVEGL